MIPNDGKNNATLKLEDKDIIAIEPLVGQNHPNLGNSYYYKIGTRVHIHLGINLKTATRSKVYNIPEGFRPKGAVSAWGGGADGMVPDKSFAELYDSGDIWVKSDTKFTILDMEYDAFN